MGLPEARLGLLPGGGGTQRLPFLIGEAWAKRLILFGERLDAATAERIGLVHEVVPSGTATDAAVHWAAQVGGVSPAAVSACKMLIERARELPMSECLQREQQEFMRLFGTADQREGITAFFEKRPPVWTFT
jgi:enoyl-CoA hydratase/carnithine racemase